MPVATWFFDFETFYTQEYSLKRMTPVEYILDPRFEAVGCAIKEGVCGNTFWVDGPDLPKFFADLPKDIIGVSHNWLFDGCILAWRYNFIPQLAVCTLSASRALLAHKLRSLSLDNVSKYLGLPPKGNTVHKVIGLNLDMIKAAGIYDEYVDYSKRDADNCALIFDILVRGAEPPNKDIPRPDKLPVSEILIMDTVMRAAIQPRFHLNQEILYDHLGKIEAQKNELLARAMLIGADGKSDLMSNERFAELLRNIGVEPPTKISPTTGKLTYAFAKTDQGMVDLEEHEDPSVQALAAARLGHKSTIEESRVKRLISISNLQWPAHVTHGSNEQLRLMPVPLRFSGAHTHRLSGDWKLNMQNLPRGSALRRALIAPPGHKVLKRDASQIEARVNAWFCGQDDLVAQFARGEDVYSNFASHVFGEKVTKKDKPKRFVGKTCVSSGSLLLTNEGWLPIELLKPQHKLWDGVEWVCHSGLVDNGLKQTVNLSGLWLTPDHLVLCGKQWMCSELVVNDLNTRCLALATGAENLPLQGIFSQKRVGLKRSSLNVIVGVLNTLSREIISKSLEVQGVKLVQNKPLLKRDIGVIQKQCHTTNTVLDYLIGCQQLSPAATTRSAALTNITAGEEFLSTKNGEQIALRFYDTYKQFMVGIYRSLKWIASTWMEVTAQVTFGLFREVTTQKTNEMLNTFRTASKNLKQVYDVLNCGPRNRFTVLTNDGPIIVHNCVLGLGYQTGWAKLQHTIKVGSRSQLGEAMIISDDEAKRIVRTYRAVNHRQPAMWDFLLHTAIPVLAGIIDPIQIGPIVVEKGSILLPNGLRLYFPNTRYEDDQWVYDYAGSTKKIYGGALLENIIQALARICTMDAAARIRKRTHKAAIWMTLQAHDELVYIVPDRLVEPVNGIMREEMDRRPWWAPDLPLASEGGVGPSYGQTEFIQ